MSARWQCHARPVEPSDIAALSQCPKRHDVDPKLLVHAQVQRLPAALSDTQSSSGSPNPSLNKIRSLHQAVTRILPAPF